MSIVKQILLKVQQGQSKKGIVRDMGLSKNTLRRYIQLIQGSGYPPEQLIAMEDQELEQILNQKTTVNRDHFNDIEELFPWIKQEIKLPGVNRFVLWGEYRKRYPSGYSYSQFCWHFQQWLKAQNASMIIEHEPGDKIFVDFAGKKMKYHDRETDKDIEVEFFAGLLGHSQLSFACAVESQCSEDFLSACRQMLEYFGGSTRAIVCDNLKSGVSRANRYEPEISQSFSDFCNHYQMSVIPTRVAKPKDKPLVEGLIRILYSRIYAPLRNRTFYSLNEINMAIAELLEQHNNAMFSRRNESRRQVFESTEKQYLNPLPADVFELKYYRTATVQKNSHILLGQDKHYYSVPMRFIGKQVSVIYTANDVNIFIENQRIAYHKRSRRMHKYTTVADHLPSNHRYMLGLSPDGFIQWGQGITQDVGLYLENLIKSKNHPEQAYKSCQGIQSLARKLGKERLISACSTGLELKVYNYMFIRNIMENRQNVPLTQVPTLPFHENIRGPEAYK
ncbi:MAG: IS21 family transposase [Bacteroidota bacterium]